MYALLLVNGDALLMDPDTHWHIAVGKWILDHSTFPRVDTYSFTKAGEPWISTSWLAQVLYAGSFEIGGWPGPIILAATCVAGTFAFFAFILGRRIRSPHAIMIALAALAVTASHLLARPHVVALPVMLAWVNGLVNASERREPPSFWLLPLMALWANLHGGFVFGLALIVPLAFDAWWNAEGSQRGPLALRWIVFGACAFVACCATPYGWGSILAARKILALGELLNLISEWSAADFSHFSIFEGAILALIACSLYFGLKLSPPRIILAMGLFHMALSHVRNADIFAFLMPLVVLTPVASQFSLRADRTGKMIFPTVPAAMLVAAFGASTWLFAAHHRFSPPLVHSPAAAIDVLKLQGAKRVLNDYPFGGYLISRQIPVFIDSRAELYGELFVMAYFRALQLKDVNQFLSLLKEYEIDAVLLMPATPATGLLDHLDGWQRVYSDETAVVHIRDAGNAQKDGALR
ncbi:hypothetical protein [Bradyrhizobium sp. USDA 4474]